MKTFFIVLTLLTAATLARGQGTITLGNTTVSLVMLYNPQNATVVPTPTTPALNYGVFVNGSVSPILPLATSSMAYPGMISAPTPYVVSGFNAGETVQMQIRGWSATYGEDWQAARAAGAVFGETSVRPVTLGPANLGTIIWQGPMGTSPNRFYSLVVSGGGMEVRDITVAEGSNGVVNAVFTVTLPAAREQVVTVDYTTQDGSATAGSDYQAVSGTLTFAPGETSRTITVVVTADAAAEDDESFSIVLSNPINSALLRGTATCLITEARISEIRIDTAVAFHTVAGRHYAVERSSDMASWTTVQGAEDVLGVGGDMTIHDRGTGCTGVRYYRTRLLTP